MKCSLRSGQQPASPVVVATKISDEKVDTHCESFVFENKARPLRKPTSYEGETSWVSYLAQFQIISEINNWDETENGAFLATSLKGKP